MRLNFFARLNYFFLILSLLNGCSTAPRQSVRDGPGSAVPPDIASIPDAVPKFEPLIPGPNKPYTALGQSYVPDISDRPFSQRGIASWYGRKFHGNRTASGEIYDMYGMSAAHTILPIPSYARVTLLSTGKSVVVRINDRGPFVSGRVIDLSYTAAAKLGLLGQGSGEVRVERVFPTEPGKVWQVQSSSPEVMVQTPAKEPVQPGISNSRVEVSFKDTSPTALLLQAGAFSQITNANNLAEKIRLLLPEFAELVQIRQTQQLWRIVIGPFDFEQARAAAAQKIETTIGARVSNAKP
ncbi:MAG: septal ring lytic transglycosylase RlpA family protein [Burkholderiaceae bacterium]|nr:septal ring lytic transglycosylase RlpA family protein [Burkholderiaceae bacterium]